MPSKQRSRSVSDRRSSRRDASRRTSRFVNLRLDSVRRAFGSDAQVARALGVNPAQVARWRRGQEPDDVNAERLAGLDAVIEMLDGYLSATRIPKWLSGANANLGERSPLAALLAGDLPAVIGAVRVLKSGAHA
jgi:transcriptional regulator with XRE-family HTH domain